jgi:UDP-GlcNAc:undecaprenyl-phosphate GlcNAc-1-phosphate transferase
MAVVIADRIGPGREYAFRAARTIGPAVVAMFMIGLTDDIFGLRPLHKLVGQVFASLLVVASGLQIHYGGDSTLDGWIGAVATVAWLVGCANAVNLIDGVDGLASGIALLGSFTILVAALMKGNVGLALVVTPLAGALLGFLVFNFNPASIFLGDCGSLTAGLLLGCYGLLWSDSAGPSVGMTAPLIAFAIPLLDVALAIVRRFLRRRPIFGADRSHIHHQLLGRGLSPRRVVLLLYIAAGLAGALAVVLSSVEARWGFLVVAASVGAAIVGVVKLGYAEFRALHGLLRGDAFRFTLNGQIAVEGLAGALSAAATPQECWRAILTAANDFGFNQIAMRLGGQDFKWRNVASSNAMWDMRVPISDESWVELSHGYGLDGYATAVVAFADTIRTALHSKDLTGVPTVRSSTVCTSVVAGGHAEAHLRVPVEQS